MAYATYIYSNIYCCMLSKNIRLKKIKTNQKIKSNQQTTLRFMYNPNAINNETQVITCNGITSNFKFTRRVCYYRVVHGSDGPAGRVYWVQEKCLVNNSVLLTIHVNKSWNLNPFPSARACVLYVHGRIQTAVRTDADLHTNLASPNMKHAKQNDKITSLL